MGIDISLIRDIFPTVATYLTLKDIVNIRSSSLLCFNVTNNPILWTSRWNSLASLYDKAITHTIPTSYSEYKDCIPLYENYKGISRYIGKYQSILRTILIQGSSEIEVEGIKIDKWLNVALYDDLRSILTCMPDFKNEIYKKDIIQEELSVRMKAIEIMKTNDRELPKNDGVELLPKNDGVELLPKNDGVELLPRECSLIDPKYCIPCYCYPSFLDDLPRYCYCKKSLESDNIICNELLEFPTDYVVDRIIYICHCPLNSKAKRMITEINAFKGRIEADERRLIFNILCIQMKREDILKFLHGEEEYDFEKHLFPFLLKTRSNYYKHLCRFLPIISMEFFYSIIDVYIQNRLDLVVAQKVQIDNYKRIQRYLILILRIPIARMLAYGNYEYIKRLRELGILSPEIVNNIKYANIYTSNLLTYYLYYSNW